MYIRSKDWKGETEKAVAIARCESGLNSKALNNNPRTGDFSVGVYQVNLHGNLAKNRPSKEWLMNPKNNVDYANEMFKREGFRPWTCSRKV